MEELTFTEYPAQIAVLDEMEVLHVSGGALPVAWAIGFGLAAVFGGAFAAGYKFGRDYWGP